MHSKHEKGTAAMGNETNNPVSARQILSRIYIQDIGERVTLIYSQNEMKQMKYICYYQLVPLDTRCDELKIRKD